ncbi:hypothetical protein B0H14DRAFT_2594660, partial [Mycena olivaceomarginata]
MTRRDTAAPAAPIVDLSPAHSLSSIQLDSRSGGQLGAIHRWPPGDSDFVFPTLPLQDDPFMVAPVAPVPDFSTTLSYSDVTNVLSGMYGLEEEEEDQLASLPSTPQKPIGGWQTHPPPPPKHPLFDPEDGAYNFDGGDAAYESSPLSTVDEEAQNTGRRRISKTRGQRRGNCHLPGSHVRATEKASPSAHRAVKRRAKPIGANPGPALIQTSAAALAAPPHHPLRKRSAKRLPHQPLHRRRSPHHPKPVVRRLISSPTQYRGNLQDFVATNEFQEVPLPPPPGLCSAAHRRRSEMPELQEVERPEDDNEDDDVDPPGLDD